MAFGGAQAKPTSDDLLLDFLATFENRPYDYAIAMFPWGEPGTELEHRELEAWQVKVLKDLQDRLTAGTLDATEAARWIGNAILIAIKSGKNVGKTALLSIIIWWAFSTKVNTKGRATANTEKQLSNVLWTELAKWHRLFLCKQFFRMTATRLYSSDPLFEKEWHFDAVPWSEDNPDAWSGIHNQDGRLLIVFDEASGIHDSIWERADGATREANTQVIWTATSNPTKNSGRFYECFNRFADWWMKYTVDSREVRLTNHVAIEEAIKLWGLEDDYTKMSFLGEFPSSSFSQLIPAEAIRYGRVCEVSSQPWEPLILGVDVARYGDNETVAVFRRGRDARTLPTVRRRGLSGPECGDWIGNLVTLHNPDGVFIDAGGLGGPVVDFVKRLGHSVVGVNFGGNPGSSPEGQHVLNKRAEMYILLRNWLREGGCIENSDDLETQLLSIDYKIAEKAKDTPIQLMSKDDMRRMGRPSPDIADAIALTFAYPVTQRSWRGNAQAQVDYDPLGPDALTFGGAPKAPLFVPQYPVHLLNKDLH